MNSPAPTMPGIDHGTPRPLVTGSPNWRRALIMADSGPPQERGWGTQSCVQMIDADGVPPPVVSIRLRPPNREHKTARKSSLSRLARLSRLGHSRSVRTPMQA